MYEISQPNIYKLNTYMWLPIQTGTAFQFFDGLPSPSYTGERAHNHQDAYQEAVLRDKVDKFPKPASSQAMICLHSSFSQKILRICRKIDYKLPNKLIIFTFQRFLTFRIILAPSQTFPPV